MRRAVVVGAGIGGLAAAIGLRRAGWQVTVLERAPELGEIGAGITLWSNALRALDELDVAEAIRAHGTMQGEGGMRTPGGRWLSRSSGAQMAQRDELSLLTVHRAHLHTELAREAGDIVLGAEVTRVGQGEVGYTGRDGERTLTAEVVVGADGIHSRCRHALHPAAAPPAYAGFTTWRGVTERPFALPRQSETLGRGAEFGLTQLVDGRVYWFATGNEPEGASTADEHAEVLRRFGGWHEPIGEVVRATAASSVLRHDVYQSPCPLLPFAGDRIALLGDAAHACTPNLGQGACLALEDAVTLAAELAGAEDVPAALRRYDATRRPRAQAVVTMSDRVHRLMQASNPLVVALRAALIAGTPASATTARIARITDWTAPRITGQLPR